MNRTASARFDVHALNLDTTDLEDDPSIFMSQRSLRTPPAEGERRAI
jgi:hypothetical protein